MCSAVWSERCLAQKLDSIWRQPWCLYPWTGRDAAAERVGHCAMMASDIVDGLMDVLRKQEDTKRQ